MCLTNGEKGAHYKKTIIVHLSISDLLPATIPFVGFNIKSGIEGIKKKLTIESEFHAKRLGNIFYLRAQIKFYQFYSFLD